MPLLSTDQIARFQAIQASSLPDLCTLHRRVATAQDNYGISGTTSVDTANVACGFKPKKVNDLLGNAQVPMIVGELRLAIGTEIDGLDEISLTSRYGATLDEPQRFKADGTPIQGATGIVVHLIKATV